MRKDEVCVIPKSYDFFNDKSCWLIAKSHNPRFKSFQQELVEGDFIKLGRVFFHVKEININKKMGSQNEENNFMLFSEKKEENTPCRICLSDSTDENDILISPCKCIGSLKCIHLNCLKEWLKSKIHIKNTEAFTYISWEKLECELCKTNLSCIFFSR